MLRPCNSAAVRLLFHPPNFLFPLLEVNMGHVVFCFPLHCPGGVWVLQVAEERHKWSAPLSCFTAALRWSRRDMETKQNAPRTPPPTPLLLTSDSDLTDVLQSVHLTFPASSSELHSLNCTHSHAWACIIEHCVKLFIYFFPGLTFALGT